MSCNQFPLFVFLILSPIWLDVLANSTCSLPSGKSGGKKSVNLAVYDCFQATLNSKTVCGKSTVSNVALERGKTVNINYEVNNRTVMAKFFGEEVCVSYMELLVVRIGAIVSQALECDTECFSDDEKETYQTNISCTDQSCLRTKKRLRFVVSSGGSTFSTTFGILIGFALLATGLLF